MIISSCSFNSRLPSSVRFALDQAGANRRELLEVIKHYSQDPGDNLKLRATYFLISNMPGHKYWKLPAVFDPVFDSLATYPQLRRRKQVFNLAMEKIKREHPRAFYSPGVAEDLKHVTADFLIGNIDLAFEAYDRMPVKLCSNFNDFCEYVLPYRNSNEPLEFHNRKKQYEKHQWVYKALDSGRALGEVVNSVLDSMNIAFFTNLGHPAPLSGSQIQQTGFGRCSDLVNYAVNVFRAIGIPASNDFALHWGNHHSSAGHDWLAIHAGDSLIAIDVFNQVRLNELYRKASLPKAFRRTYARYSALPAFAKDVTHEYKPPNHVRIANRWNKDLTGRDLYLMVFDRRNGWFPLDKARSVDRDSVSFANISTHVVFMAAFYNNSGTPEPVNYPFIIDGRNRVGYLDPDHGATIDSAVLLRKYPPYFIRDRNKQIWVGMVKGLKLQGSNSVSFTPHHDLLTIWEFNSTHVQTILLSYKGRYRYYRVTGPEGWWPRWLATLRLDSEHEYVRAYARGELGEFNMELLEDGNPLTWVGDKKLEVGYMFSKPVKVTAMQIQARNDDNHIRPGDTYELLYWDKTWRSLGRRVAGDTLLIYRNVPKGALYWLRNHSRGREEHVFTITETGEQYWPGVSNYLN